MQAHEAKVRGVALALGGHHRRERKPHSVGRAGVDRGSRVERRAARCPAEVRGELGRARTEPELTRPPVAPAYAAGHLDAEGVIGHDSRSGDAAECRHRRLAHPFGTDERDGSAIELDSARVQNAVAVEREHLREERAGEQ